MAIAESDVYNLLLLAGLKSDLLFNSKMASPELRYIALIHIFVSSLDSSINLFMEFLTVNKPSGL